MTSPIITGELTHAANLSKPKCIFCSKLALENTVKVQTFVNSIKLIVTFDTLDANGVRVELYDRFISSIQNGEFVNCFFL